MIEQHEIDIIKQGVDLVPLMRSCGIDLKQIGNNFRGYCPFHEETSPSLTVNRKTNLWNCFGCDKGGDNIRFVQLFDKLNFNDAVERLKGYLPEERIPNKEDVKAEPVEESEPIKEITEEQSRQLLERTLSVYEQNCSDEARDYLAKRGITDLAFLNQYRIGYSNGKFLDILPSEGGIREDLVSVGILNEKGLERFNNCLVFPVYDFDGNLSTFYGRPIRPGDKRHIFLPNRPTGLWNISTIKTHSEIILVESVIDALSVLTAGFDNVISC
jgi:DNA primase